MYQKRQLTGPEKGELRNTLNKYITTNELRDLVEYQMDVKFDNITFPQEKQYQIRDVIEYFNNRMKAQDLLIEAIKARPKNEHLLILAQNWGLATQFLTEIKIDDKQFTFESIVNQRSGFASVSEWAQKFAAIQHQVCHIEEVVDGDKNLGIGSGFLVAPDIVMTNYHVIQDLVKGTLSAKNVRVRFDFLLLGEKGVEYELSDNWQLPYSEPNWQIDSMHSPLVDPTLNQLDYAFIRLNGKPGNLPLGGVVNAHLQLPPRGWLQLANETSNINANSIVVIFQHPKAKPMKLAFDTVLSINTNQTRIRYRTNTGFGSSGSPCFDMNLNLIALHHVGDTRDKPEYNQGVPIWTIVSQIRKEKSPQFEDLRWELQI